jgi:hypothetical protein
VRRARKQFPSNHKLPGEKGEQQTCLAVQTKMAVLFGMYNRTRQGVKEPSAIKPKNFSANDEMQKFMRIIQPLVKAA